MKHWSTILLLPLCVLLQTACSNQAVYPEESFSYDSLFKLRTDGDVALACDSARRALLGQGYLIASSNSEGIIGRKAYKSEGKENTFIEMNIVCLPETSGSTVFATGVLSTYALKMSSSSASVGLSALGSISLPIGQSADSLVKVSEETIDDKDFYRRFFALVDTNLSDLKAGKAVVEPAAEPIVPAVVPEPAPIQTAPVMVPVPGPATPATAEPILPQVAPAITPQPLPAPETPAVMPQPEPAATRSTPAIVAQPESTPETEAPMTVPEQFPAHLIESFK